MLSQFLLDIGAGSLSPSVSLPAEGTRAPLSALHERVKLEIDRINVGLSLLRWAECRELTG